MKLSLIVPVYNVASCLPRLFRNIIEQNFFGDVNKGELILVNDGSTDSAGDLCKSFSENRPWVKYTEGSNQGLHMARNKGMRLAEGEYICFLDADDLLQKGALSQLLKIAEETGAEIVRPRFSRIKEEECDSWFESGDSICKTPYGIREYTGTDFILSTNGLTYHGNVWGILYKKSFLIDNDLFFDSRIWYMEDIAYNWKVYPLAKKVIKYENPLYKWVIRSGSLTNHISVERKLKNELAAEMSAVYMRELFECYNDKEDSLKSISAMMKMRCHWAIYKYLGTLVKFRGLAKGEIGPTIKRLKEEGVYPYPHKFPRDLPEGYPTSLRYRVMWRLMSYEWILKLMLRLRTRKVPLNIPNKK